jgi:L-2-hydroxyglutarate oxidase LhgO
VADTPLTVVGAGVVGLAVAARLAAEQANLVVLERNDRHGLETSSRNSEVIHAGIYYPEGSLKARLCVEGKRQLYALCERRGVPHRKTGKIVSATSDEQLSALDRLEALGRANDVPVTRLTRKQTLELEPHVRSVGALLSPSTGIVNAHAFMDALLHGARQEGAILQFRSELVSIERRDRDYRLTIRTEEQLESFTSERVVNAAGLESDNVAALAGIDVDAAGYRLHYAKGSYFSVRSSKAGVISRLVYPVPGAQSLGVHAVLGLEGRLRFGPDVEFLVDRRLDYQVDESKRAAFGAAVNHLIPSLGEEDLTPDMAGIRPKLQAPGEPPRDFVVSEETERGLPGFVDLIGIDSPGLTAALAIADHVAVLLKG